MREKQQGSENLKVEKAEGLNQQSPEPQGLERWWSRSWEKVKERREANSRPHPG